MQYTGNIEEYFSKHSEKLVAFVINPRLKNKGNSIRLYKNGQMINEKSIKLSENVFLYYFLWYVIHLRILWQYFSPNEKVAVITFHPITLFGMSIQKLFRNVVFVYWIADYFPPVSRVLRMFEALKRYYNRCVDYSCYLSDAINEKMNGRKINSDRKKTVMWSIISKEIKRTLPRSQFSMLFVGVIKKNQGLEQIFNFLKSHKTYSIKIVGNCAKETYQEFEKVINQNKIEKQVYFPNKFLTKKELENLSKKCYVGVALYNTSKLGATYYTDPGKVKTYAQLGLPIIMSNIPTVAKYVKKFRCGEIIDDSGKDLGTALTRMKKQYGKYIHGLKQFNNFFYYDTYFKKSFKHIEKLWM